MNNDNAESIYCRYIGQECCEKNIYPFRCSADEVYERLIEDVQPNENVDC